MRNLSAVLLTVAACCSYPLIGKTATKEEGAIYVQVKATKLRKDPAMIAPAVGDLAYGDRLNPDGAQNGESGWFKARDTKGRLGYVHRSAVTLKKIVMSSRSDLKTPYADPSDVVLAGKGFNKEVEKEFAQTNSLDFRPVNEVERLKASHGELVSFVRAGNLGKGAK